MIRDRERLFALSGLRLLDTPAEVAFDRMTRLATDLLDVHVALVTLVDRDHQFFKSYMGPPGSWESHRETPRVLADTARVDRYLEWNPCFLC